MEDRGGCGVSLDLFLVCEDVRLESNGQQTIVGVFSDVIHVPVLPLVFPRLSVLVRVNGLAPGKHANSLSMTDETLGQEVVSAGGEHEQSAQSDSTLALFTFRFGAVQARSWGVFTLAFTLDDAVRFNRSLRLRPPNWDMIYVQCGNCKALVPSGIAAPPGTDVQVSQSRVRCSNCRQMTEFDDRTAVRLCPPSHTLGHADTVT